MDDHLPSLGGFQKSFKDVSSVFQESSKGISRMFQGRLKGVSREISVGFKKERSSKGILKVF